VRCSKDAVFQNVLSCLNCDSKGPPVPCAGGAKLVFDHLNARKRLKTEAGVTFLNPYAQQERIHNGWSCPAEIWATGLNTGTKFLTDLFYENFEASQVNSTHDPNLVCRAGAMEYVHVVGLMESLENNYWSNFSAPNFQNA